MTVLLYSGLFVYDRILFTEWYSLVAKMVKNLPAMWDTQVQSLGQKDPLEKEMVPTLQVFLPGEFHGQRSLVSYSPRGRKELDTTEQLHFTSCREPA